MLVCVCLCAINTKEKHRGQCVGPLTHPLHIYTLIQVASEVSLFVLTPLRKVDREGSTKPNFNVGGRGWVSHQLQMITKWQSDALKLVLRWPLSSPSSGGTSSHRMSQRMPLQASHEPLPLLTFSYPNPRDFSLAVTTWHLQTPDETSSINLVLTCRPIQQQTRIVFLGGYDEPQDSFIYNQIKSL
jgi:hypothetical protein